MYRLLAGEAGLEPATFGFGDRCSSQLSYSPAPCYSRLLFSFIPESLFCFLMHCMFSTEFAVLFLLDFFLLQLLVPCCCVISSFTFCTLQGYDFPHLLLSCSDCLSMAAKLIDNIGDRSGSDRAASLSYRKPQSLLHRHVRYQLDLQIHIVSRHHHLHSLR